MGLLGKFFGSESKEKVLCSPVKGKLTDISGVSDETFAEKILGDGIAVIPSDGNVCAPCDAKIDNMFETGHAFSLVTEDGLELLVHVGFDTVKLKGEHFNVLKNTGDKVKCGEKLVEADMEKIAAAGYDTTVVMVILNSDEYSDFVKTTGEVEAGSEALRVTKK